MKKWAEMKWPLGVAPNVTMGIPQEMGALGIVVDAGPGVRHIKVGDAFIDRRHIPREVFGVIPADADHDQWMRRAGPFRQAVFAANEGKPVDKVFEHTGGLNFPLLISVIADGGCLAFFGATGQGLKGEYKETFFHDQRRFVMDARWVWMRQKQVVFSSKSPREIFTAIGLPPGSCSMP